MVKAIQKLALKTDYAREGLDSDPARQDMLTKTLDFFYGQTDTHGLSFSMQALKDIFTDVFILMPSLRFLRGLSRTTDLLRTQQPPSSTDSLGDGRHYLYLFNYYPPSLPGGRGMYHGDELNYEFDQNALYGQAYSSGTDDRTLTNTFRSMLTNFAKSGDPMVVVERSTGATWTPFNSTSEDYLSLDLVPRMASNLYSRRAALWDNLLPSLVNSTQAINSCTWSLPWQQQQQYIATPQHPVSFEFKGTMSFFKLN